MARSRRGLKSKRARRVVDEGGRDFALAKVRVSDQGLEKAEVGRHPAYPEFAERPTHARRGFVGVRRPRRDLLQQRVVEGGDHRAGVGGATVETDAEAVGATVGGDAP